MTNGAQMNVLDNNTIPPSHARERIMSFELMRVAAFILVVALHTIPADGPLSRLLNVFARLSVPFFFSLSGFFLGKADERRLRGRFLATARICLACTVLYLVTALTGLTPPGEITPHTLKAFLLWNDFSPAFPLWYLFALLYVYGFFAILVRLGGGERHFLGVALGLWLARLFLTELDPITSPQSIVFRSWLFTGVPMFGLGMLLARKRPRLEKASPAAGVLVVCAGFLLACLEYRLRGVHELYVGSVVSLVGVYTLCLNAPMEGLGRIKALRGRNVGRAMLCAYVVHYAVMMAVPFPSPTGGFAITALLSLLIGTTFTMAANRLSTLCDTLCPRA